MFKLNSLTSQVLNDARIKTRPNANPGVWLMFLLPSSIILCAVKHPQEASHLYYTCACLSLGLLGTSAIFVLQCARQKPLDIVRTLHLIPAAITATVCRLLLQTGLTMSLISGLVTSILYWKLLLYAFHLFPLSFTLGEASVAAQALILFLYSTVINIGSSLLWTPVKVMEISTIILQIGLCSIGLICYLVYRFSALRKPIPFYLTSVVLLLFFIGLFLHALLRQSPLIWIVYFLFDDINRAKMVTYCAACSVAAITAVNLQIRGAQKATPAIRKVFHIFAVAVYVPGILYHCSLLYLASGVTLGIFIALELLRILNMPPLGESLQSGYLLYRDEKDTGKAALTPLYLLAGCSLPLWVHPAPCDILDSAGFNLLPIISGVLAIGVGDTLAGVVGTTYGKHKWPGTQKTVEGTVGCIISQLLAIWCLAYLGLVGLNQYEIPKAVIAVVIGSLVEARTTQIDNIVLPLILFIILC